MQYKASLIGFHNPYKHKGLSPEEFLTLYVNRKKGNYSLNKWIKEHWKDQIIFVSRLFPQTLDVNKVTGGNRESGEWCPPTNEALGPTG
jgi:hypothetical protein